MREKEAKTILSTQNGMNIYRGGTDGLLSYDTRNAGDRRREEGSGAEVKINAPQLLEVALRRKRSKCMIVAGALGDPYQPEEAERKLMRRCLELIDRYGFGVTIQTKSDLLLRDLELLKSINRKSRCIVQMTLTAADEALNQKLEPGACSTARRVETLKRLRDAGIPTVAWLMPVLPFINDSIENLERLLESCVEARVYGVLNYGFGLMLRPGERDSYYAKLEQLFPGLREQYRKTYGEVNEFPALEREALEACFHRTCAAYHIESSADKIFTYLHAFIDREAGEQLSLEDVFGEMP
ncbi:MAG: SPL family radical SAM protein [Stomatobaculum sp.]